MTAEQLQHSRNVRLTIVLRLLSAIATVLIGAARYKEELRWALHEVADRLRRTDFTYTAATQTKIEEWVDRGLDDARNHLNGERQRHDYTLPCSCAPGLRHYSWCPKLSPPAASVTRSEPTDDVLPGIAG